MSKKMLKAAILSISLGTMISNSASVILGSLQSAFPNVPKLTLQCFVTYPTLMVMVFTLFSGILTTIVGAKIVLLVGLVIFTVSGMMPMVLTDFNAMLISRLCLGAGLGLVSPLAVGLIMDYYEGEERVVLVGQQFAVGNMGQTASMLIVGFLSTFGWRKAFWIYSTGLFVFVFTLIFLPRKLPKKSLPLKEKPENPNSSQNTASVWTFKMPFNWKIVVLAIVMFCYNTTYLTTYSNLALIMKQEGIGTATMVGYALAFMTTSGMCVGMFFGKLYQRFGNILGAISAAAVGLAFFLMIQADSMFFIAISLIIMGAGNSLLMPFGYYHVGKFAPKEGSSFSMSIIQVALSAGSFFSPYIFGNAVRLAGHTSGRFTFFLSACVLAVGTVCLAVYGLHDRKRQVLYKKIL